MKDVSNIRILVACERSQEICGRFLARGFDAWSCDLQCCAGPCPERHLCQDVTPLLEQDWDLIIAHPPCTYLALCGNRWFDVDRYGDKARQRIVARYDAMEFFMLFANNHNPRIAIENPIGHMSSAYRKPDQIVNPFQFGDSARKPTCLWLKGLPKLHSTNVVDEGEKVVFESGRVMPKWYADLWKLSPLERSNARSKTFPGIASAMVDQWGDYLLGVC